MGNCLQMQINGNSGRTIAIIKNAEWEKRQNTGATTTTTTIKLVDNFAFKQQTHTHREEVEEKR